MSTREERKREIFKAISEAKAATRDADWTKESPEISAAEDDLNEAMADYVEGVTSKANVRNVYQRWRDLHKVEVHP